MLYFSRTSQWLCTWGTTGKMSACLLKATPTRVWLLMAAWWRRFGFRTCSLFTLRSPSHMTPPRTTSCWEFIPMERFSTVSGIVESGKSWLIVGHSLLKNSHNTWYKCGIKSGPYCMRPFGHQMCVTLINFTKSILPSGKKTIWCLSAQRWPAQSLVESNCQRTKNVDIVIK